MFRGKASVHARDRSRSDATPYGDDTASYATDAYSNTESSSVSEVKRIRHEHTSTVDPEASMETAEGLGGFRQVLRAYTASEFRSYSPTSPGTAG